MADEPTQQWPGTEEVRWPGTEERPNPFDVNDDPWPGTRERPNPFDVNDDPVDSIVAASQTTQADRSVAGIIPTVRAIMGAFGERFGEDYQERLGLSEESKQFLAQHNVLPANVDDYKNPLKPFMAFNEGLILPLAAGIEAVWRAPATLSHCLSPPLRDGGRLIS